MTSSLLWTSWWKHWCHGSDAVDGAFEKLAVQQHPEYVTVQQHPDYVFSVGFDAKAVWPCCCQVGREFVGHEFWRQHLQSLTSSYHWSKRCTITKLSKKSAIFFADRVDPAKCPLLWPVTAHKLNGIESWCSHGQSHSWVLAVLSIWITVALCLKSHMALSTYVWNHAWCFQLVHGPKVPSQQACWARCFDHGQNPQTPWRQSPCRCQGWPSEASEKLQAILSQKLLSPELRFRSWELWCMPSHEGIVCSFQKPLCWKQLGPKWPANGLRSYHQKVQRRDAKGLGQKVLEERRVVPRASQRPGPSVKSQRWSNAKAGNVSLRYQCSRSTQGCIGLTLPPNHFPKKSPRGRGGLIWSSWISGAQKSGKALVLLWAHGSACHVSRSNFSRSCTKQGAPDGAKRRRSHRLSWPDSGWFKDIAADTPFSCPDSLESSYYFRGLRGSGTSPFVAKSLSHSTKRSRGHFRSKWTGPELEDSNHQKIKRIDSWSFVPNLPDRKQSETSYIILHHLTSSYIILHLFFCAIFALQISHASVIIRHMSSS